jgi:hypothetical protein
MSTEVTRETITEFSQHICNLGVSYGLKIMTLEDIERHRDKMIDELCAKLGTQESKVSEDKSIPISEIPLSEDLKYWRAERPDEWTMDRFIRKAKAMENKLAEIVKVCEAGIIKICEDAK